MQAVTASGGSSHYLDSSSQYLRYYASAIKSARMNAPSLLPVLVFLNSAPDKYYLEWVLGQVRHAPALHGVLLLIGFLELVPSCFCASGGACDRAQAQFSGKDHQSNRE